MVPYQPDLPDAFLHRLIDDLTAVRALANLARHALPDAANETTRAHLAHLDLVVMAAAERIQSYRRPHAAPVPPVYAA